jgi:hypothetical protein
MRQVPSIGRIVHYYTNDSSQWFNGAGSGPYPAIITQVFNPDLANESCNLKILPPFGPVIDQGSVLYKENGYGRINYWDWPPHVGPDRTEPVVDNWGGFVPTKVETDDR